ncbi:protein NOI4-like [Raphanus sativus]|uniref:Protein NOI4-like n=1 Tax=Raphanus sativus TaxID=3726 RepID=A0A6J0LEB4_RAPSA|nr:protein NOI4-like [Raphanus sativus]XP_056844261.1 protein NOI4-like [Raphanus sativus]
MATENKGRPLPKFGEWDVNNPASAEGFTVIFSKASDEKKTKKASGSSLVSTPHRNQISDQNNHRDNSQNSKAKKKWLCFR